MIHPRSEKTNGLLAIVLCMMLAASLPAQEPAAQPNEQTFEQSRTAWRASAERALKVIEHSSAEYLRQRECFSCHHQAMSIQALMTARKHGLKIDYENLQKQVQRSLEHLEHGRADYLQGKGQGGGVDTAGYALLGLSAAGMPRNPTTDAVAEYLLQIHSAKKHWGCTGNRPPTQSNDTTTTAIALCGLVSYGPASNPGAGTTENGDASTRLTKRLRDCDQWFERQSPADTEERVFRIMAEQARLKLGQDPQLVVDVPKTEQLIAKLQQELLQSQRDDGGWAQLPVDANASSDAYATATALMALADSGYGVDQPVYVRGLNYLLKTQQSDGSWHVATRSQPIQKYFESGFPHGVDQFISMSATCWAAMALVQPLPVSLETSAPATTALPWIANATVKTQLATVEEPVATQEQLDYFEREIRPLLVENCASCHSSEKQSGGLRVDSLAALLSGGDTGPALVPRDPRS